MKAISTVDARDDHGEMTKGHGYKGGRRDTSETQELKGDRRDTESIWDSKVRSLKICALITRADLIRTFKSVVDIAALVHVRTYHPDP